MRNAHKEFGRLSLPRGLRTSSSTTPRKLWSITMISADTLKEIVERLKKSFKPEKIILFGSYATGKAEEASDIDLLIVAETDLPAKERFCVVSRLLGDYPAAFDVILKT